MDNETKPKHYDLEERTTLLLSEKRNNCKLGFDNFSEFGFEFWGLRLH
ncbi:MAG TPA: hypothetical protein PLQ44_02285 [Candidatus Paceibacterota bacterium]|nr:hypothetical protein [Candidatus Paceibacterota bacterium]